jgi:hypothetical protein
VILRHGAGSTRRRRASPRGRGPPTAAGAAQPPGPRRSPASLAHAPRPRPAARAPPPTPQILDLRLGNTDRNGGNILARRGPAGAWELVPIDHGCCLPDSFEDLSFEWAWWPQAERPFGPEARAYIAALDADRDAAALAAHGLSVRPGCLRVLRVCTMVLKKAAAAGLTPAQIAAVVSRQAEGKSPLEKMHAVALALAARPGGAAFGAPAAGGAGAADGVDEAAYLKRMEALVDELLEDLILDDAGQLLL